MLRRAGRILLLLQGRGFSGAIPLGTLRQGGEMHSIESRNPRARASQAARAATVALFLFSAVVACGWSSPAQAIEIIPAAGVTRSVDSEEVKPFGALFLRTPLVPGLLKTELAVAYRSDTYFDGNLKVRQWPVAASLWLAPGNRVYGGAGVGWYHTTLDYEESTGFEDQTKQKFGVHVGGGLGFPLTRGIGLDLHGRYVMLRDQESRLVPEKFDPDFWVLTLGLNFQLGGKRSD